MARRYVWGRYTVEKVNKYTAYDAGYIGTIDCYGYTNGGVLMVEARGCKSYKIENGLFTMVDPVWINSNEYKYSTADYPYCICMKQGGSSRDYVYDYSVIYRNSTQSSTEFWDIGPAGVHELRTYNGDSYKSQFIQYKIRTTQVDQIGSQVGTVSNRVSNTYPNNGVSGSYWYLLRGNDVVDPSSVSYDSEQILTQQMSIQAAASTGNKYGGTITYDYQVCVDGSSWVNVGSFTALSMSYTIPDTATQFQARVRARDNMGFTSSTWVTGPLATVRAPWVHHRLHRKNDQQVYDLVHFMTSAENVVHNNTSNVQATIDNIKQRLGLS